MEDSTSGEITDRDADRHAIVLFDGVCNLCNGWVRFVIERDRKGHFLFASLQSETGRRLRAEHGLADDLSSILLIDGQVVYDRSSAVLRIARQLRSPWPAAAILRAVPRPIRDNVYDWIAARRYSWFGKQDACPIPSPETRGRFLDT